MRRGFSIFLVLFFGLGPLSALVDGSENASLPSCCRRHGEHHCAMNAQIMAMRALQGPDSRPVFDTPQTCPDYPGFSLTILVPAHAATIAARNEVGWQAQSYLAPACQAAVTSLPLRAHAGRGPPDTDLS